LTLLTGTHSEAASYEFTTLTCIPGIIHYNDTKIQLLDLPGIIEGASEGKGRGRQVKPKFTVSIIPLIAFTILFSPIN
jgi:ribosome-interacting GTPase 1